MTRLQVDLLLDPFGADWRGFRDAAATAEESCFDGIWTWDHLAGGEHDRTPPRCWTVLALAVVPRVGPLS
jgi:alkanesulfonate monooxygenase SsuD/methylene tetrahydromethanopterin reductase-like flavin-dependent oxidoreductase (luciferase family)